MKTTIIEPGCYNIVITITNGGGTITSDLMEIRGEILSHFNTAMNALESLILAHACAGIDICDKKYIEGIYSAVSAIEANIG